MINSKNELITGIIIAAGKSSRMGQFKPLMKYSGRTFIHHIISKLDLICRQIIIVTGFNSDRLKSEAVKNLKEYDQKSLLSKIRFVENMEYESGMFTSLQRGLKEIADPDDFSPVKSWVVYHFVDQPGLPADFYTGFIEQIDSSHNWIQPSYNKQNGHPVLLKNELFKRILETDKKASLRDVSKMSEVKKKIWECGYKNILQDLDTPEDFHSNGGN